MSGHFRCDSHKSKCPADINCEKIFLGVHYLLAITVLDKGNKANFDFTSLKHVHCNKIRRRHTCKNYTTDTHTKLACCEHQLANIPISIRQNRSRSANTCCQSFGRRPAKSRRKQNAFLIRLSMQPFHWKELGEMIHESRQRVRFVRIQLRMRHFTRNGRA